MANKQIDGMDNGMSDLENGSAPAKENEINEESSITDGSGNIGGLSLFVTKTLLQDFEASGETRLGFDLLGLCENNEDIYGTSGSVARRQVQKRFDNIKRRNINGYISYLKDLGIKPGDATRAEQRAHRKKQPKKKQTSRAKHPSSSSSSKMRDDEHSVSSGSDASTGSNSSGNSNGSETSHTSVTSITTNTSPVAAEVVTPKKNKKKMKQKKASDMFSSPGAGTRSNHKKNKNPKRLPVAVHVAAVDTPHPPAAIVVPQPQHVFGVTSTLIGQLAQNHTPQAFVPVNWLVNQNGSLLNPWIVPVNLQRAEANRGFDIEYITGIEQDEIYTRDGFHIRLTIAAPDHEDWTATIPTHYDTQYSKRVIMIKGPSRDYWQRSTERYHEGGHVDCDATYKAHSATGIAIEEAPARQWSYQLLVFPPSIVLNNHIFSRDEEVVPIGKIPLKSKAAENPFKKDIRAMVLFWKIATKGGKKVGKGKKSKSTDATMFD
jgi:hypothetical protein